MTLRALVIDDYLEAAECLARLLEAIGHSAAFVINPLDALDAAEGLQPEVVLIDLDMPRVDGWQLARQFRSRFGPELRLFAITGLDSTEHRQSSARAGFDAHLVKPISMELLVRRLSSQPASAASSASPASR